MTDDAQLRVLALADIHYGPMAEAGLSFLPTRYPSRGLELVRAAIRDAHARGGFDAIALMGDLVEDGDLPDSEQRWAEIRDAVAADAPGAPVMLVSGNHDRHAAKMLHVFGLHDGLFEIGGYRFVVMTDVWTHEEVCTRPAAQEQALGKIAAKPGGPLVVLMHNPMNPPIDADYPFMLTNRDEVMADYTKWGVFLCICGHYHPGQDLSEAGGVLYYTCPTLDEAPYRYVLFTLRGRTAAAEVRVLGRAEPKHGATAEPR